MFPGSFIWNRISDKWLNSKFAAILFAFSSAMIAGMTGLGLSNMKFEDAGSVAKIIAGIGGILTAASVFLLWGGMWSYWLRCDPSVRLRRRLWFILLIVGFWYGAILYYAFVYLPTVRDYGRGIPEVLPK